MVASALPALLFGRPALGLLPVLTASSGEAAALLRLGRLLHSGSQPQHGVVDRHQLCALPAARADTSCTASTSSTTVSGTVTRPLGRPAGPPAAGRAQEWSLLGLRQFASDADKSAAVRRLAAAKARRGRESPKPSRPTELQAVDGDAGPPAAAGSHALATVKPLEAQASELQVGP